MRIAISAVIIERDKLLLVKKRNSWILPGGKIEKNEGNLECLSREVSEELSGTKICNEKFYRNFEGQTPYRKDILKAKVYFANIDGKLNNIRREDSISDSAWVKNFEDYNLSDITIKIINSLKKDKYLE